VLVATTDPITLTCRDVGRFAVVVNANDVAVMGVRPRWFLVCVLLPVGVTGGDVVALFATMRDQLAIVGATLVGGHTEITPVVTQPVVIGQMLGLAESGRVVTTAGARPGETVVQIGPVPLEGAAVLAAEHGAGLGTVDGSTVRAAANAFDEPGISVVEAALAAADLGATALHDPTEGGLAGGLHELAARAEVAVVVDRERIVWFSPGLAVCAALRADPWATLASGGDRHLPRRRRQRRGR
jgi:hydrogenase maturation factor